MAEKSRTDSDHQDELEIQLHLLEKACREFDAGDLIEVRNTARALRVILTADSHGDASLIERVHTKKKLLPDTRILTHPLNIAPEFKLTGVVFGQKTAGVRAFLDTAGTNGEVPYDEWMEQTIADDKEGTYFSRHRLIKAVANLGGGTHYPSDIRRYYAKLENAEITASSNDEEMTVRLRDVEKHSLRQISFEVLRAFGRADRRGVRAEYGATLIRSMSSVLYPGRGIRTDIRMKARAAPAVQTEENKLDSISGFMTKLPYEGTGRNDSCPCKSGLKFKNCCETARDFDPAFVDAFEKNTLSESMTTGNT